MKVEFKKITVRELTKGYVDNSDEGVVGYGGKLDIRPPYQREFIYKDKQRDAVIETVVKKFPLNVMYWAVRNDGNYEIIDGQQRTISICQYVKGDFSIRGLFSYKGNMAFHNLQDDEQKQILDYELMIYRCSGTDSEKLNWFKIVNIAGEELNEQELRNAVYYGPWVTDAKRHFSKYGCISYNIARDYVKARTERQEYLETAIKWISKGKIDEYMSKNQGEQNANKLLNYFRAVINWVETTFAEKRPSMRSVDWGPLYDRYKDAQLDTDKLEKEIEGLMLDDDISKKPGIYPYVLTRDERFLHLRRFPDGIKLKVYEAQGRRCKICKKPFDISEMEADHIRPWSKGGKTTEDNCQMLCDEDHKRVHSSRM